ncbi:MAG: hypothetical protein AAF485_00910 [Chloroflexota bacterium]
MSTFCRRLISFAGSTIAIDVAGQQAADIVSFLYRDIPDVPMIDAGPTTMLRLVSPKSDRQSFELYRDDQLLYESDNTTAMAERLLGESCYHLADRSQGGLLFHAACVQRDGKGIMLVGESGAGKSTLTVWLLTQGFSYLTDELVFIPFGTCTLQTFTRPLNLKSTSRPVIQHLIDFDAVEPFCLRSSATDLIPATVIQPQSVKSDPELDLIIFPHYQSEMPFSLDALSKAKAGLSLMEGVVNARNLPDHGFDAITALAKRTPAYKMVYADFAQVEGKVDDLLTTATAQSQPQVAHGR